jgi:hypothetical protein
MKRELKDPISEEIQAKLTGSSKTLEIENEEMQDAEVEEHLIAAVARGVDVRVVMSPPLSGEDANAPGQKNHRSWSETALN